MSLVTRYDYRNVTGDMDALDSDVDAALATGLQQLEEFLDRSLEAIARTETVRIHPDGRAYVRCQPLQSVSDPPNTVIRDGVLYGLIPQLNPSFDFLWSGYRSYGGLGPGWSDQTMDPAIITYVGGYTSATLPRKLRQAICELARVELQTFAPLGASYTSASVEGVSVTYAEPPDREGTLDRILGQVEGFRRREVGF